MAVLNFLSIILACALRISNISDTVWRKQFLGAVHFLHEILHFMLSSFAPFKADTSTLKETKNVLLADVILIVPKIFVIMMQMEIKSHSYCCLRNQKKNILKQLIFLVFVNMEQNLLSCVTAQKLLKEQAENQKTQKRKITRITSLSSCLWGKLPLCQNLYI